MRLPILGYHKVGTEAEFGRRLTAHPRRLASHAAYFARRGFRFATVRELDGAWPERGVAFTFDDGFAGAVAHGLPIFERLGARATVYVVTDLVGGVARWPGEDGFPLASWDELRQAQVAGHEVGNHTRTHPRLGELAPDAQRAEIEGAAEALAREGIAPGSFCHPYGSWSAVTQEALGRLGFRVAVSTRKGVATDRDDRLLLPRIFVAYGDSLPLLLYRVYLREKLRRRIAAGPSGGPR